MVSEDRLRRLIEYRGLDEEHVREGSVFFDFNLKQDENEPSTYIRIGRDNRTPKARRVGRRGSRYLHPKLCAALFNLVPPEDKARCIAILMGVADG